MIGLTPPPSGNGGPERAGGIPGLHPIPATPSRLLRMLFGRDRERERIGRLLEEARGGRSGLLVLRGEPGIGKTALLGWAAEQAQGMTVLRARGVERDAETPFTGLLELLRPIQPLLDAIPERQANALRGALALGPAVKANRFLIGAATLSVLARAAEEEPLLLLVDDAQWLDPSSLDALVFAASRFGADSVATLLARRDGEERSFAGAGLEVLELAGLEPADARLLLAHASFTEIAPGVERRLYELTRGNPLGLLELPSGLGEPVLSGRAFLPEPVPVGRRVEQAFAQRVALLGADARQALVVVSASPSEDLEAARGALASLGLDVGALAEAEDAGLVRLEENRIRFRHPLVRSSVYQVAAPSERRRAHAVLAAALRDRPEERAWHLGEATVGADEAVAAELERSATAARGRSGYAAAASALQRAARLSESEPEVLRRLLEAARAASSAGQTSLAVSLIEEALPGATDPRTRAELLALRGQIAHLAGDPEARTLLQQAATVIETIDPGRAVAILVVAVESAVFAASADEVLSTARRLDGLSSPADPLQQFFANLTLSTGLMMTERGDEGRARATTALELVQANEALFEDPHLLAWAAIAAGSVGRLAEARVFAQNAVALARDRGVVGALPFVLRLVSRIDLSLGRWPEAYAAAWEALRLARETGQTGQLCDCLTVLATTEAAQGKQEECRAHADEAIALSEQLGLSAFQAYGENAKALLELSHGRLPEAAVHFRRSLELKGLTTHRLSAANLVEIEVRMGELDSARETYRTLMAPDADASDGTLRALAARSRGLVADDAEFEPHFVEALACHAQATEPFERARTHLCFGERLRRTGERRRGRTELHAALEAFEQLGAAPWAERASKELRASGERLRRRDVTAASRLTPQELQIALVVAEGRSNREVGASLFLSPKTVEWHLTRIYRKLEVFSRAELIRLFADAGGSVAGGSAALADDASPGVRADPA